MSIVLKPYADVDIKHTLGDSFYKQFIRQTIEGVVVDITNYTYLLSIRKSRGGSVFINIPVTLTTPLQGVFTASQTPANLTTLENKTYFWDLEETNSAGVKTTIIKGEFKAELE